MGKVAVLFESSGTVRDAFIDRGHSAISFDLLPSTSPKGKHVVGDVVALFGAGGEYDAADFDLIIAHPPCTYLTISAEWCYKDPKDIGKKLDPAKLYGVQRQYARLQALAMVWWVWKLPCKKLVIENPRGVINKRLPRMPKPQWIQPHEYGADASKCTGLWKRGLPDLIPTKHVPPRLVCPCGHTFSYDLGVYGCPDCCGDSGKARPRWANQTDSGQNRLAPSADRWQERSKTYPGIGEAFADQWGVLI